MTTKLWLTFLVRLNISPVTALFLILSFISPQLSINLKSLDIFSNMGPDGIHPHLLQSCADQPAYLLYVIFTFSLTSGHLCDLRKVSNVAAIFKKGPRSIPLNLQTNQPASVCVKNLERIGTYQLYQYLEDIVIISDSQLILFTRIL